jgi:hypothetical protein
MVWWLTPSSLTDFRLGFSFLEHPRSFLGLMGIERGFTAKFHANGLGSLPAVVAG